MNNKPVYPKEDPEYNKKVFEDFLKKVRNQRWDNPEEIQSKPRGRKPKQTTRPESRPRTEGERKAANIGKNKFFNF
jgi:hypothetical protein